jgi:hypothetical protein
MSEPKCYSCKHRGPVPGSHHASCQHPILPDAKTKAVAMILFLGMDKFEPLNVTANAHGIAKGWFVWPVDFDPVWLNTCDGYERREVSEDMNDTTKGDSSPAVSPTNATNATKAP